MVSDSELNAHRLCAHKKELIDLKLQIALQQEQLDLANHELNHALVEVTALKAEKSTLIDELTTAKQGGGKQKRIKHPKNIGGSMQILLDKNAKLMIENVQLRLEKKVLRKTFRSYIDDNRKNSSLDKECIQSKPTIVRKDTDETISEMSDVTGVPAIISIVTEASTVKEDFDSQEKPLELSESKKESQGDIGPMRQWFNLFVHQKQKCNDQ